MCFPFLAAQGHAVGASLCADEDVELARRALDESERRAGRSLQLPGRPGGRRPRSPPTPRSTALDGVDVPDGLMGLDIGPRTAARLRGDRSPRAGTVFWNGPMGAFELEPFAAGTRAVARGGRRGARHDRRRRRRLGRGDPALRAGRPGHAPLDRRRRGARADRGQAAARAWRRWHERRAVRTPLIAGNWKMHKTVAEAEQFIQALLPRVSTADGRRRRDLPAVPGAGGDGRLDPRLARPGLRPEHAPGRRGRVHGRGVGADARRDRRRTA